ncbi:membrane protein YqaA with SNARE-associated domain [Rhodoligotrophos appendicifer]|uniref:YqaA family protein n=1 Tax=Rhodoligotrophos appendicifer TaxID=987056 RepID=UPI001184FAB8|nr:YqaA family protein [Rhodoligotrophos appendicifer]
MFQSLYDRTLALAGHRHAERWLGAMCFAESSFLPMLPEVMLLPMILADRTKAWRLALLCTITSVLGGVLGYFIGIFLFDAVGAPLLRFYGLSGEFEHIAQQYNDLGWLMVLIGAVTPVPYKVVTIASGLTHLDFMTFLVMSAIGRGVRFFAPCALFFYFGPRAQPIMERNLSTVFWLSVAGIVGGTLAAKFIF